ncbi:class I SAM-dependent methyltransferase [Candidatus Roizmanbacteria bacterium]|nr:class I SAM-dependent methyltransferase [Candidatus Roizmanbacteria bacterium]
MNINQLVQQIKIPLLTNPPELAYFVIHQERYKIILQEIMKLNLPKNSRVLDIGCYPLHLFTALQREPFEFKMNGIASNHEPVTEENIAQLNIEKEKLPFKKETFDLVLMTEVVEHLTVDPRAYLTEVKRVLKNNGYLLITTPNAAHLKNRMKLLSGKSAHFPLEQLLETNVDDESIYFRHNREFTMEELKMILQSAKYEIRDSKYESFYTPFREGKKKNVTSAAGYFLTQIYPPLQDSLLVLARKR